MSDDYYLLPMIIHHTIFLFYSENNNPNNLLYSKRTSMFKGYPSGIKLFELNLLSVHVSVC